MTDTTHPRKPLLALCLSLALPGFGQFYNGELNRAIWLFLAISLLVIPGMAAIALHLPASVMMPALVLATATALGLWVYAAVDAWRGARRRGNHVRPAWQTSGAYALVLLACDGLALPLLEVYVHDHQVASFRIPSHSMEPGILAGDVLFADRRYNCPDCRIAVARGDVAIFTYPNDRTLNYIKRIIALPGDRVRISGHTVWVNDQPLSGSEVRTPDGVMVTERSGGREWRVRWNADAGATADLQLTVPAGQVFVLGDNRSASKDTRDFGTVPLYDVSGRARQIWFSWAPEAGLRRQRLGMVVQ